MVEATKSLLASNNEAIRHLKQAIAGGKHWYLALLEAIGLWDTAEETDNGRSYRYLIAGEAFDWLLLAERLCQGMDGLVPEAEKTALLFQGVPPLNLPPAKFKELLGCVKHRQYLNYFYGITVEEALVWAVEAEVRKERRCAVFGRELETIDETYQRIYGVSQTVLLRQFREDKGYPGLKSISLTELKEFAYWRFKYRLKYCDKARTASDTRKALDWLESYGFSRQLDGQDLRLELD